MKKMEQIKKLFETLFGLATAVMCLIIIAIPIILVGFLLLGWGGFISVHPTVYPASIQM